MQIASTIRDSAVPLLAISSGHDVKRQASPDVRMEFEKAVSGGLPRFRRVAMRWLRNREDAEDAVQDAMLSAFRHIAAFDGRAQLSTWITAIVINSVRMQLRRRSRCQMLSLDQAPEEGQWAMSELLTDPRPTPEQTVERSELREFVVRLTCSLPDSQRTALRLRQRDGLSIREAAETLGVPEGTLKAQLARGRAALTRRFHEAAGKRPIKAAIADAALNSQKCSHSYRLDSAQCEVPVAGFQGNKQGKYAGLANGGDFIDRDSQPVQL
jgi:RNA polymerase sigma-70 factor (ECF subfamily)